MEPLYWRIGCFSEPSLRFLVVLRGNAFLFLFFHVKKLYCWLLIIINIGMGGGGY